MKHRTNFVMLHSIFYHYINVDLGWAQKSKQSSNEGEGKRDKKLCKMSVAFSKVSYYLFPQLYAKHKNNLFCHQGIIRSLVVKQILSKVYHRISVVNFFYGVLRSPFLVKLETYRHMPVVFQRFLMKLFRNLHK